MSAWCWLNGSLVAADVARIDPADRGFTLGDGLFETVRVADGRPLHLGRHLARLEAGCALLRLHCPWNHAAIAQAASDVIQSWGTDGNDPPAGSLRITLTRGAGARGVLPVGTQPSLLVTGHAQTCDPTEQRPVTTSVRAIVCQGTRRNERSPLCGVKSLNYLDSILARLEAQAAGATDAILLNTRGQVAEATTSCVFALCGAVLLTPPTRDGALPGIARALLLERGGAREASLTVADLQAADALMLANSLGIAAVGWLDGTDYPPSMPLLTRMQAAIAA